MRRGAGWLALGLALGPAASGALAHISGKVEVLDKGDVRRRLVRDVVVYVDGVKAPIPDSLKSKRFKILMQNKAFSPHVEAVPLGTTMSFPNLDPIMHNVFSLSPGNRFDLDYYKSGASKDFHFENPGLVRIFCNIHPQMSAFVLVMENPYFTWARPDGTYRIEAVPPGSYRVKAWHDQAEAQKEVSVGAEGVSGVDFLLDARRFKSRPHLNKFGKPYQTREKY